MQVRIKLPELPVFLSQSPSPREELQRSGEIFFHWQGHPSSAHHCLVYFFLLNLLCHVWYHPQDPVLQWDFLFVCLKIAEVFGTNCYTVTFFNRQIIQSITPLWHNLCPGRQAVNVQWLSFASKTYIFCRPL